MIRQPRLGYLVADGARARLMLRHADGRYDVLSELVPEDDHPHGHDTRALFDSGSALSAPAAKQRKRFAAALADAVSQAVAKDQFDDFVVAAPARMLREIRAKLPPSIRSKLRQELARDLTKSPGRELRRRLDALSLAGGRSGGELAQ